MTDADSAETDVRGGSEVTLYRATTTVVDTEEIATWLRRRIASEGSPTHRVNGGAVSGSISVEDRFLDRYRDDDLPEAFAAARVLGPYEREIGNTMLGIVRYEEQALEHPDRAGGVLYDGLAVQRALNARLPEKKTREGLHVALLDRALGTWGDHDRRWHKRVTVLGQPALVSVPGLYEAPAKPEAYYKAQQKHALLSGGAPPREALEKEVEGEFLVENDPRTTETLKGYVLQAVHFWNTGRAFCEEEHCRLYNAHRQPGVVKAQLRDPEFCGAHAERYA